MVSLLILSDETTFHIPGGVIVEYTAHAYGLYAMPSSSNKTRDPRVRKFEFVGRFLAQALLDARMIDMPLNSMFYRWLLNDEDTLSLEHVAELDPLLYDNLIATMNMSENELCDMALTFTVPGYEIPLVKVCQRLYLCCHFKSLPEWP